MKKLLICCGALCMTLLLFCGTALAADVQVAVTNPDSANVEKVDKSNGDVAFKITKSGAESGQLYLIMIQEGSNAADNPKPTKDNLYYLNVEETAASWEAYPKDLNEGTYVVYLSDYSTGSDGAAKGVALITVTKDGNVDILYGDVNGDGTINGKDRMILARYVAKWDGYGPDATDDSRKVIEANSDLDGNGKINGADRMILARHVAKWADYQTLPYKK